MSDIVWVIIFGLAGGLAHELLNGGFTFPLMEKKENAPLFYKFGSLGEILLGAGAAFVTYASSTPSAFIQICLLGFISGIGGSAILKAYVNGQVSTKEQTKVSAARAYVAAHTHKVRALEVASGAGSTMDAETTEEFMKLLNEI